MLPSCLFFKATWLLSLTISNCSEFIFAWSSDFNCKYSAFSNWSCSTLSSFSVNLGFSLTRSVGTSVSVTSLVSLGLKSKLSSNSTGNVGSGAIGESFVLWNASLTVCVIACGVFVSTSMAIVSLGCEFPRMGSSSCFSSIEACCTGAAFGSTDFWTDRSFLWKKKLYFFYLLVNNLESPTSLNMLFFV